MNWTWYVTTAAFAQYGFGVFLVYLAYTAWRQKQIRDTIIFLVVASLMLSNANSMLELQENNQRLERLELATGLSQKQAIMITYDKP